LLVVCATWCVAIGWTGLTAQARPDGRAGKTRPDLSLFAHSGDCQACHNNLTSPSGEDVSIGTAWRATMMANSSRDPYWQASIRREVMEHPSHAASIQDECGGCHMPMSTQIARTAGGKGEVFAHLPVTSTAGEPLRRLAADGVSCTVCHQIAPDGLGTRERFNGRFLVTPPARPGVRQIYGPYEVDKGRRTIMRSVTRYEQVQAPHIRESALCAACHTLYTNAIGPDGLIIGSLPEQMNFQEWQHSAFRDEGKSCQSCHLRAVTGPVRVASVLGEARESLARHTIVGGNAFMLRILNRYRSELGVTAGSPELEAAAGATERQLQGDTATVSVSPPGLSAGVLTFDVDVRNLTGHKFPTGYPARRAWLHVVVRDSRGVRLFESGGIRETGAIEGSASDGDFSAFEPHYDVITRPDQVQVYESVLGDSKGVPTTGLLTAVQYLKDNRLLPRGFDKATAGPDIAVHGGARDDASFADGGDRVRYEVSVGDERNGTIEVELRYQSVGFRWARNLEAFDAVEPRRFVAYYKATAAGSSVLVAHATAQYTDRR
jgi:hypothetical protein